MACQRDPLFLALTRPAMVGGVTYSFLVINLMVTAILFVWTGRFLLILLGVPVHILGYVACLREPRRFDLWWVRLRSCLPTQTRFFWGGNSYRP
jgi:type IV secretion system protein VirB3